MMWRMRAAGNGNRSRWARDIEKMEENKGEYLDQGVLGCGQTRNGERVL